MMINLKDNKAKKSKKLSMLEKAERKAEKAIVKTNEAIEQLGKHTSLIYSSLIEIQDVFDKIRNIPNDKQMEYESLKQIRLNWKDQVDKIEKNYRNASIKNAGGAVAGASAGVAIAALGPTAAMGVATSFGVASTGTAIATLSGAAQINATLAWLGGGALAAGGGGMSAGGAFLALFGPIGWTIAGVSICISGTFIWLGHREKKMVESIYTSIANRDAKIYELAIVELNERIERINKEIIILKEMLNKISTFGLDYDKMTEEQQYALGTCFNTMNSSTSLLVDPIMGLQPKLIMKDIERIKINGAKIESSKKQLTLALGNLLYKIELDKKEKKAYWKSLRKNKVFLKSVNIEKKDFKLDDLENAILILNKIYPNLKK